MGAGQHGLNAGVVPDPGFTYQNLAINYSAEQLNDLDGHRISGLTGTYSFWVDENIFMFIPKHKVLGGYFCTLRGREPREWQSGRGDCGNESHRNGGGAGLADTMIAPVNFGWAFGRVDFSAGYAFTAPTGRYSAGASDNVGSGYWGNNLISGTTCYITKSKGASLFMDWEDHGRRQQPPKPR